MSDNNYKSEDDIIDAVNYRAPLKVSSKPATTSSIKKKVSEKIDLALAVMFEALNDPKKAYSASREIMSYYVTISNLEMKEDLHKEEMRFRKHKNRIMKEKADFESEEEYLRSVGNADLPEAKFSMHFDDSSFS